MPCSETVVVVLSKDEVVLFHIACPLPWTHFFLSWWGLYRAARPFMLGFSLTKVVGLEIKVIRPHETLIRAAFLGS